MSIPMNILAATDFSPASDDAVDRSLELAAAVGGRVHLLHVFSLGEVTEHALCGRHGLPDARHDAEQQLHRVADARRASGRLGEIIFRVGDPASLITAAATQLHADLVVLGTHGRRGFDALRLGSVAARVLQDAPCSVWVVRSRPATPTETARAGRDHGEDVEHLSP